MTFGSLFTGGVREHGGGFDLGLIAAGFTPRWEVEITRGRDVRQCGAESLERVDLICGGPPCQRVSGASRISGTQTGETLWLEMLRIVAVLKPTWVLVEQPASVDRSLIVDITEGLQRSGYGVSGRIVNSVHWLPQYRARWFVIGRMGAIGVALRDHLYVAGERLETLNGQRVQYGRYLGSCTNCMRGGIPTRFRERRFACVAAGNAVSVPVAQWLGEQIRRVHADGN